MTDGKFINYRVKAVHPLPDYILKVEFENGEVKYYDVKKCFERWPVFNQLKENPDLFYGVKNEVLGVIFNEEVDLDCNELYYNGEENA